ncbi:signal peptidase II [Coriobacterium glomerans]|nr:signal peptidase II [Coriobacterium glomerans]
MARRPPLARRLAVTALLAASLIAADRISKNAAVLALASRGGIEMIPGIMSFRLTANTGMAFSLGAGLGVVSIALTAIVSAAGIVYLVRAPIVSRLEPIGLGMLMGGSIGNAIDRVLYGSVTDFIQVRIMDFPIFNVADIGITLGILVALFGFMKLSPANQRALDRDEAARDIRSDIEDDGSSVNEK